MAAKLPCLQALRPLGYVLESSTHRTLSHVRHSSSFDHLHAELVSRRLPLLYDNPTPLPSHLLNITLAAFLPPPISPLPSIVPLINPFLGGSVVLPPSHHLIYFPPPSPLSLLLPDGTDPDQSPGEPFVRRVWAGGRMNFYPHKTPYLSLDGSRAVCYERISDLSIKGLPGEEKVFITVERRISRTRPRHEKRQKQGIPYRSDDELRELLLQDRYCSVIENRTIVFMRERNGQAAADATKAQGKVVRSPHTPTFSQTIIPTAALLFRFSALTFNAHRIHLDKQYCREIEGHRNLLVHGPLSVILMVEMLSRYLASTVGLDDNHGALAQKNSIVEIEYRNLAPLYAEEEMKICGRNKENGLWHVWIEGKDGGYAVKGEVKTGLALQPFDG
ncbi:hypothetical protein MMC06_003645 [Schaereria dolodes]|nr:hypothetical protein [Schaereria dolodes]